ncbi:sulfotransferase (plasmid) [Paracoccus versutus]|uniref:Sulfotransferase family protein n=2 Tax=Paracoccus versutus TaxID=34007 RepID=A0AAQ0HBZ7_PARVE|nr:sulfotransferase [Paracoccus versutus]REG26868.1 sulfotransferase family protein [Paracoccus versutus]WEJ80460.1 sulfotransferase [Paracoccus versutus]
MQKRRKNKVGKAMNSNLYPALYAPKEGYVFLVTYGRSGSTLMTNYLNSFPGYCIRGENNNVLHHLCAAVRSLDNVNFTFRRQANLKPLNERRPEMQHIMETPKDPWYGAELVDPGNFAKAIFNDFVREILSPPPETRVSGFKEIRWVNNMEQLEYNINLLSRYFPNARFVFQTRDAGAISRSGWWKQRPREAVEKFIKNADAAFLACAAKNDASIHVRYEDIVEGEGALRKVAEFLGEDFCTQAAYNIISERLSHLKKNS